MSERPNFEQQGFLRENGEVEAPPLVPDEKVRRVREVLAEFIDLEKLRTHSGIEIRQSLRYEFDAMPLELRKLVECVEILFGFDERVKIKSPADVANLLMLEMGSLQQEELRTVLLDTKNRVQKIHTVYKGSVNSAMIRVGEVYREAIRLNSAAFILAHNHPSNDPTPSPEDILVTGQIVEAGKLLDCECLDHLIVCQSRWVSMRERGLGFSSF